MLEGFSPDVCMFTFWIRHGLLSSQASEAAVLLGQGQISVIDIQVRARATFDQGCPIPRSSRLNRKLVPGHSPEHLSYISRNQSSTRIGDWRMHTCMMSQHALGITPATGTSNGSATILGDATEVHIERKKVDSSQTRIRRNSQANRMHMCMFACAHVRTQCSGRSSGARRSFQTYELSIDSC